MAQPFLCTAAAVLALVASGFIDVSAQATARRKPARSTEAQATASRIDFSERDEVRRFIADLSLRHGFVESELRFLFSRTRHYPAIIDLITPPANPRTRSWHAYRARFIEPIRIKAGVELWQRHAADLARAEAQYGVPAAIIVAIMGVETVYGRNSGNWRVIDALTTLAFDYPRRAEFFRSELENYLLFAREREIDVFSVRGSYAGAIGIPQFMPSSWRKWAVDFDGDGRIDLRESFVDSIGSIASYLKAHGWIAGAPIAFPARVEGEAYRELLARDILPSLPIADLARFGVTSAELAKQGLPPETQIALFDLVTPDQPSDYWIGLTNFYVITRYNRSSFYAMSVMELADAVSARRARR